MISNHVLYNVGKNTTFAVQSIILWSI